MILSVYKLTVSFFLLMILCLWYSVFLGAKAEDKTFAMLEVLNDIPTFIFLIHNVLTQWLIIDCNLLWGILLKVTSTYHTILNLMDFKYK